MAILMSTDQASYDGLKRLADATRVGVLDIRPSKRVVIRNLGPAEAAGLLVTMAEGSYRTARAVVTITVTADASHVAQALDLRHRVFIGELARDCVEESDAYDATATHVVALGGDAEEMAVIGTLRLYQLPGDAEQAAYKIGRLAVEPAWRDRGIGREMMAEAHDWARAAGAHACYLYAEVSVTDFYRRLGYVVDGLSFDEAGRPHVKMRLSW